MEHSDAAEAEADFPEVDSNAIAAEVEESKLDATEAVADPSPNLVAVSPPAASAPPPPRPARASLAAKPAAARLARSASTAAPLTARAAAAAASVTNAATPAKRATIGGAQAKPAAGTTASVRAALAPSAARKPHQVAAANSTSAPSAAAASSASSAASSSSAAAAPLSAGDRHRAYLASLVAARELAAKEERRRKPDVKSRLTSTFTLSAQKHQKLGAGDSAGAGASAGAPLDRASLAHDAAFTALMPRVFSMLGGSSIDCLRAAFVAEGWVENTSERSGVWSLQWSIVGRVIDYASLKPGQLVNHFQRSHAITSKVGLAANMNNGARLQSRDTHEVFPRCFELHTHDREAILEFRREFRANIALNYAARFLRAYETENRIQPTWDAVDAASSSQQQQQPASSDSSSSSAASSSPPLPASPCPPVSSFSPHLLQLCLIAFQAQLRLLRFEMDGLDNSFPLVVPDRPDLVVREGHPYANLTEAEWAQIETEVDRLETIDRNVEENRIRTIRKAEAMVAATTSAGSAAAADANGDAATPADPSTESASEIAAVEEEEEEKEKEVAAEDEEIEAELDELKADEAATSPQEDYSPDDEGALQGEEKSSNNGDEEEEADATPSLASLSLLSRSPLLSLDVFHSYFLSLFSELRDRAPHHYSLSEWAPRNLWILKPGGLSRGRGIEVHRVWAEVLRLLARGGTFIAQKYIERPLLIHQKKFDIRQWVLLSTFSNVMTIWFYTKGCYLRFSGRDFTLFNLDAMVHLTNNSIQKHDVETFDSLGFARGNMWGSEQFVGHLDRSLPGIHRDLPETRPYASGPDLWTNHIQARMKSIATLAIHAGANETMDLRPNSFTLLGFDFMLSSNLHPWLIEVNSSPTLVGIAVPELVQNMSRDLVQLVTTDPWSPLSDTYVNAVKAEKERLANIQAEAEAKAKEEADAAAAAQQQQVQRGGTGKRMAASSTAAASKPGPESKRATLPRAGSGSSTSASSSSASSASASAASASAADPFILPTPHPLGYRVGGFEVVDSSFIGIVPRSHRTNTQQPPTTTSAPASSAETTAASSTATKRSVGGGAAAASVAARDKKAPVAAPTGLFVTGKAIPPPFAAAAAAASASTASGSKQSRSGAGGAAATTAGRRSTLPARTLAAASAQLKQPRS